MKEILKKYKYVFIVILVMMIFFSFSIIITHDTSHYHQYLKILNNEVSWQNWDIARGIVFPIYLFLSQNLFGYNVQSMLIPMFILYLVMLAFLNLFIMDISKEWGKWRKRIIYILNIFFVVLNPLVFGYYHVLLTEFIGMTFAVISCYLAWKLLDLSIFKDKLKYILITLYFALAGVLLWHLKQPHFSAIIFPLGISVLISIIREFKLKNIVQRLATVVVCFIFIFLSLITWNTFLESRGIEMDSKRNINNILGNQIIKALYNYEIVSDEDFTKIEDYQYLTTKEIDKAKEYEKDNLPYKIINIKDNSGKVVDQDILQYDINISSSKAVKYTIKTFFEHPLIMLDGYITDYLALIDVYETKWDAYGNHWVTNGVASGGFNVELVPVGMNIYRIGNSMFYVDANYYDIVSQYNQDFNQSLISKMYVNLFEVNGIALFKISFLLLPFMLLFEIVYTIALRKKLNKSFHYALLIILSYCFLHCLLHVYSGAIVDRYLMPTYSPLLFAYIIILIQIGYFIYSRISRRKRVKGSKEKKK